MQTKSSHYTKIFIIMCLAFVCFVFYLTTNTASAATRAEFNHKAKEILNEYYAPENFTNTCLYNIEHCYSKQPYEDKDQLENIYKTVDEITKNASTDKDKIKAIHDWICTNITYAEDQGDYNGYPYHKLANPFSVYKNKEAICYGFANLTQLMLQHENIPCVIIRGDGSTHVWNAIYINNEWLFTDNTYDANLSSADNISYRYYMMDDEQHNKVHYVNYIENWAGDACYFPTVISPSKTYHSIILNSKTDSCIKKIPFAEGTSKIVIPKPEREGRTFSKWVSDPNVGGYYYSGFGGWYVSDAALASTTTDITFTAIYQKIDPEYSIPANITAYEGSTLSEVSLPDGFSWNDESLNVGEPGTKSFLATFSPKDTDDYNIVKNIKIPVTVIKGYGQDTTDAINAINSYRALINTAETNQNTLEESLAEFIETESASGLTDELETASKDFSDITAKLNSAKNLIKTAKENIASAKTISDGNLDAAKTNIDKAKTFATQASEKTNNSEELFEKVKTKIGKFNNAFQNLKCDQKDSETDISNLKQKENNIKELLGKIETAGYENSEHENIVLNLKEELNALAKKRADLETKNKEISHSLQNIQEGDKSELDASANEKELFLTNTKRNVQNLQKDISTAEESIKTKEKQLSQPATKKDITKCKITLSNTVYTYTGKQIKPKVTVKGVSSSNYSVSYSNNIKVGKATILIKGKNNYYGSVKKTFKINPKKTNIIKLTKSKKSFTVKWKKQTVQTTGYQIRYSQKSNMKAAKKVMIKSNKTVSKRITGLKSNKKYYVQIRTYKKIGSAYYYSTWSVKESIKTK